jgi:4'-phosphopantetheinyl transferase
MEQKNIYELLWFMNISDVSTEDLDSFLIGNTASSIFELEPSARKRISSFVFRDDKVRALLSELLQRSMIRHTFGGLNVGDRSIVINRTIENKPFPALSSSSSKSGESILGVWNFNVSHHGKYVAIISNPSFLVGLDIVNVATRSPGYSANEYFEMFATQFTEAEMRLIKSHEDIDWRYKLFYIHWSLKESFIKAVGTGLQYDLQRIHFDVELADESSQSAEFFLPSGQASIQIDGVVDANWSFEFFPLDPQHIISVARGPVCSASESYSSSAWPELIAEGKIAAQCKHCQSNCDVLDNRTVFCGQDQREMGSLSYNKALRDSSAKPELKSFVDILSILRGSNERSSD